MPAVLHTAIPDAQRAAAARPLPGIQPLDGPDWLTVDDAYAGQMAERDRLLADHQDDVLAGLQMAEPAAQELLDHTLGLLSRRARFVLSDGHVQRPDGRTVSIRRDHPLKTLGHLVAEDLCILQKIGEEHILSAAVLCFPASWTLAEKIGRPLSALHGPVKTYDPVLATRVQRLFDGVRVDQPIWRANLLTYSDPDLFQPRRENDRRRVEKGTAAYERSEKQVIFRLPETRAVVFTIHTAVARKPQPNT